MQFGAVSVEFWVVASIGESDGPVLCAHYQSHEAFAGHQSSAPKLDWARRSAVRCDAMRCDYNSMPVERWDQLTCEVCCECWLA